MWPDLGELLRGHVAASASEESSRLRTLSYLEWLPRPYDEEADPTHVTASAIVVSEESEPRVVLHRHKRLGIWLQPGGHVDAGEDVRDAAVREVLEETGLVARHPSTGAELVHIDVHQGPRGHVHLDTRWLLLVDPADAFAPAEGESTDVGWFSPDDAVAIGDVGLGEAVRAAVARVASGQV